jgi:hypothetical protein
MLPIGLVLESQFWGAWKGPCVGSGPVPTRESSGWKMVADVMLSQMPGESGSGRRQWYLDRVVAGRAEGRTAVCPALQNKEKKHEQTTSAKNT